MPHSINQPADDPRVVIVLPAGVQAPEPDEQAPFRCPCCGRLILVERVIACGGLGDADVD